MKVTGSGPELGCWNPANALTLHTSSQEFPVWRAGIFIDPERQPNPSAFEYKYIILPQNTDVRDYGSAASSGRDDQMLNSATARTMNSLKTVAAPAVNQTVYWEHFEGNRQICLL